MDGALSPAARFLIVAAAFVIVIAGMRVASELLVPFMTSIFIAVICMPPIKLLRDRGIPNGLAVAVVVLLLVVVAVGLGAIFASTAAQFADDVPIYQQRLARMQVVFFEWLEASGFDLNIVPLAELIRPEQAFPLAGSMLSSFGSLMTNALVILLTVIFILTEEVSLYQKLEDVFPQTSKASDTIRTVTRLVNQYMAIKAAISAFTGILAWGLCVVLGVEYAVLWGTLAFLLNFIPTFGSLLAAIPPLLLALVQTGPLASLGVAAGYLAINTVVGNIIEPRVMGRGLGLSPLVVLVSLIFWGWVLGPVGMLLSVPLTMMIKIALEIFPDTRWIGTLLGNGLGSGLNLELSPEEEAVIAKQTDR